MQTIIVEVMTRNTEINAIRYWYLLDLESNVDKVVSPDGECLSGYILMIFFGSRIKDRIRFELQMGVI